MFIRTGLLTRGLAVVLTGSLALAAIAGQDSLNVSRRPKVGSVAMYSVSANFDSPQAITFTQNQTQKVTAVQADGTYTLETVSSNVVVDFGGQTMNPPDSTVTSTQTPTGRVIQIISEQAAGPATYRIAHLQTFEAPLTSVKVGDDIAYTIPADPKLETPAVKADFKVAGLEKIKDWDTIRLTFNSAETGSDAVSSMTGTVWVNVSDGLLVKSEGQWKDVQPEGVPFPLSGKYTMIRTK